MASRDGELLTQTRVFSVKKKKKEKGRRDLSMNEQRWVCVLACDSGGDGMQQSKGHVGL